MTSALSLPLLPTCEDASLVEGARRGATWARATLYDRHARDVARVLGAVLGPDPEVADLVQETFVEAFGSISRLRDVDALTPWLRQIAVNRARSCIRRRARLRLFGALGLVDVPDPPSKSASPEVREALAETYRIIEALPVDLRIAFTLRFIDGRELVEVADACEVSLATIKRRLVAAEARFRRIAAHGGKLDDWLGGRP